VTVYLRTQQHASGIKEHHFTKNFVHMMRLSGWVGGDGALPLCADMKNKLFMRLCRQGTLVSAVIIICISIRNLKID
jgi:hypothetical protein